ncbi:MAG: Fis family transcriptional regulator [Acidobacteria bacterium]|nr:MAG: Fis family transcriptional regulator [Acidobacteriota bacterium]
MQAARADELLHEWNLLGAPEAFSEPEQLLAAFFGASTVGLAILDQQLRYQAINNTFAAMSGIPAEAHLGRTLQDVLGDSASQLEPIFQRVLVTGQPALNVELTAVLPSNSEVGYWIANYFPIKDRVGRVKQIGAIFIDTTRQKKLEESLSSLGAKLQSERDRLQVLLEVSTTLARSELDLKHLFPKISICIRKVMRHDFACLNLLDAAAGCVRVYSSESQVKDSFLSHEIQVPLQDSISNTVMVGKEAKIFLRSELDPYVGRSAVISQIREHGFESLCMVPLFTSKEVIGTLAVGSRSENAFAAKDIDLLKQVAAQVSLALANSLAHKRLQEKKERLQMMMDLNTILVTDRDCPKLFSAIASFMRRMIPHEYASVAVYDESARSLSLYPLDSPLTSGSPSLATPLPVTESLAARALLEREIKIFNRDDLAGVQSHVVGHLLEQGIQSLCCVPLITRKGEVGTLNLASKQSDAFKPRDLDILQQVAAQVAIALENARAYHEIAELTRKLAKEKLYLEDEIRTELHFEEIVGESAPLKRVLSQAKTVAPSDATTLVLGETGTGKELIARAIHRMSSRKDASFIKLNCAAIPTGLLESELFGHERGAFTGAISQKIGRLELADRGTLFLDEVGDIPLELQPKLLRVLQDHEFERLGSTRTLRVNIRLIAATNRDLARAVAEREFRSDLYYRINVFPIRVPPLRDRSDDIPLLVRYFVQKFSRRMNKPIETIPSETMNSLVAWDWPGNVRELENFIERSVILSDGTVLRAPLAELSTSESDSSGNATLEVMERQYIIRVLRETAGVIAGSHGAATRLGMKRTTLQSRIIKMKISRDEYEV